MAKARYEFGVCSACRKKIDVWASKCPWCHSELEPIIKTVGQARFVLWSGIIGGLLGVFVFWYWLGGGDKAFKKGEIEGVVHLYPSEMYVDSHKRNIKEVVFKKLMNLKAVQMKSNLQKMLFQPDQNVLKRSSQYHFKNFKNITTRLA